MNVVKVWELYEVDGNGEGWHQKTLAVCSSPEECDQLALQCRQHPYTQKRQVDALEVSDAMGVSYYLLAAPQSFMASDIKPEDRKRNESPAR